MELLSRLCQILCIGTSSQGLATILDEVKELRMIRTFELASAKLAALLQVAAVELTV